MNYLHLIPLQYVGLIFFITNVLRLIFKKEWRQVAKQKKSPELMFIEQQIEELRGKQKLVDSVSQFVEYTKIERQINKHLMRREKVIGEQQKHDTGDGGLASSSSLFKLVKAIIDNALFVSLVLYLFYKDYEIPFNFDQKIFYPLSSWLGIEERDGLSYFHITPLFAFLCVRLCNRINRIFFGI